MLEALQSLKVGGRVIYVGSVADQHEALVTAVWGDPSKSVPCINLVFVSGDDSRQDSYGRQTERNSSVVHKSMNPAHGNYYMMPGETANPVAPLQS